METLYSQSVHTKNNDIDYYNDILISDYVNMETVGDLRFRLTVDRVWSGAEVVVTWRFTTGGVIGAESSMRYVEVGYYELGCNRSDFDDTTTLDATVQTIGRVRFGFVILSAEQGEDVLPWP